MPPRVGKSDGQQPQRSRVELRAAQSLAFVLQGPKMCTYTGTDQRDRHKAWPGPQRWKTWEVGKTQPAAWEIVTKVQGD